MHADQLEPRLLRALEQAIPVGGTITTLAQGKANRVVSISADGVLLETDHSDEVGSGPQLVPAWMIQVAWDHLSEHGSLTNKHLLSSEGLNVKRSSAVCAILAQLPGVDVTSSRPITLRHHA